MLSFSNALNAWGTPAFEKIFKQEVVQMDTALLPLQQALAQSSYTDGANRSVMIISMAAEEKSVRIKTGIFYSGIIAGCSCTDDPTPMSEISEYCEVQVNIDKITAQATFTLLTE